MCLPERCIRHPALRHSSHADHRHELTFQPGLLAQLGDPPTEDSRERGGTKQREGRVKDWTRQMRPHAHQHGPTPAKQRWVKLVYGFTPPVSTEEASTNLR